MINPSADAAGRSSDGVPGQVWSGSAAKAAADSPHALLRARLFGPAPESEPAGTEDVLDGNMPADAEREFGGAAETVEELSSGHSARRGLRRSLPSTCDDAARICAVLLLRQALRAACARGQNVLQSQMVVVTVPSGDWVGLTSDAWRLLVAGNLEPTRFQDRDVAGGQWLYGRRPSWILFDRDGTDQQDRPDNGNSVVACAAVKGVPVLGVGSDPERHLPAFLVQSAELRLTLPTPSLAVLRQTARLLTGHDPGPQPLISGVKVSPGHLRLACRRGHTAEAWLARVASLAAGEKPAASGITLADMSGMDQVVQWGEALARDLRDFRDGRIGWSAVDRGVLMAGAPGVGKTTAAKAIAGTCEVPFIPTSYAAWQSHQEGHLGHVIQAIRAVFDQARAAAPCLLFIDELDSVRSRGANTHWDEWWTAIINCLLEQLDGLTGREGVVVVGATNHPGSIDPALLRAGRLDRVLWIPLPDAGALTAILRFHLGQDLPGTDLRPVAERLEAEGKTGADAEQLVRGARRRARHAGRPITVADLLAETTEKRPASSAEVWRSAVHEAAHAVAARVLCLGSLVGISIRERGNIAGWTALVPAPEAVTRTQLEKRLQMLLAGRAAEEVILGEVSGGAGGSPGSDLARATELALQAIGSWGLGRSLRWRGRSERLPSALDAAVDALLSAAYVAALALVRTHRAAVEALAVQLRERGELSGQEVETVLAAPAATGPG